MHLHIEEAQTDYGADAVEKHDGQTQRTADAQQIADQGRKYAEADHVHQRIQLNTEALFILRAVLLGTGHSAVEGIENTRQRQTEDRRLIIAVNGLRHAKHRGNQAQIGQDNGIIVETNKTDHETSSAFLSFLSLMMMDEAMVITALRTNWV